jgi:hypothetical protein
VQKPTLLLLDADVVIEAHKLGVWEALKKAFGIAVPATIVREARYFKSSKGRQGINLQKDIDAGEITCIDATASEILSTFENFDPLFMQGIDDGEKEGIAIIRCEKSPGCVFCTGDTNAVEAIGMLAIDHRSISFETVLKLAKVTVARVRPSMTVKAHDDHVQKGKIRRITGEYFKSSPLGI